jgi:hypothetical protein
MFRTLTDEESPYARANGALPTIRTAVYTAHAAMKEDERMAFWKLGSNVTDDYKSLVEWATTMPSWNATECIEDGDERSLDGDDTSCAPSAPVPMKRESSLVVDKNRISSLKHELEHLELEKAAVMDEEESQQRISQTTAADKNAELERSIQIRIDVLTDGCLRLQTYTLSFSRRTAKAVEYSEAGNKLWMGAHNGRDAALALAWLEVNHTKLEELRMTSQPPDEELHKQLCRHVRNVELELSFLKQLSLAAKVVAHVTSPAHKKLLNLCHNWLATFLPHCLAKVNRVSFGLLSADDCRAALEADPHVPRSRLKLAVPFVGKDVPSKSSEFAHPDVIIGLTVLAYRFSYALLNVLGFTLVCIDIPVCEKMISST